MTHPHAWTYYAGALGYESRRCACGLDWADSPEGLDWAHGEALKEVA